MPTGHPLRPLLAVMARLLRPLLLLPLLHPHPLLHLQRQLLKDQLLLR